MNLEVNGAFIYFTIPIFGGIPVTQTMVSSFVVTALLCWACIYFGKNLKKRPDGKQVLVEKGIMMLQGMVAETMGAHNLHWTPFIGTIFLSSICGSLIGMILMSSNALPYMQAGGTIVNIMSTAGLRAKPKETVYCAAKWGARGFTESLKEAVKGTPVNVVGVYPGGMKTEFWSPDCGAVTDSSKFMDPADVADVILHAVSQRPGMAVSDLTIDRK